MVTAMVAFGINVGIHYLNQLKFGLTYNLIQRGTPTRAPQHNT